MTSYTREQLEEMTDDDLSYVYKEIKNKPIVPTLSKDEVIEQILSVQTPKRSKMNISETVGVRATPKKKPIRTVRSTMKTPPVPVTVSVVPETLTRNILEKEIIEENSQGSSSGSSSGSGSSSQRKRGRPKKSESLEKEKEKEKAERELKEVLLSPRGRPLSKIDSIKKYATGVKVINPKASFQRPDVIYEKEKEYIQPIVVSDINLTSVILPVQEDAKQTISDFLHSIGYEKEPQKELEVEQEEVIVEKPKVKAREKTIMEKALEKASVRFSEPSNKSKTIKKVESISVPLPSVPVPTVSVPSVPVPSVPVPSVVPILVPRQVSPLAQKEQQPSVVDLLGDEIEALAEKINKMEVSKVVQPVIETPKEKKPRRRAIVSQVTATGESIQPGLQKEVVKAQEIVEKQPEPVLKSLESVKFTRTKSPSRSPPVVAPKEKELTIDDISKSLQALSFRKSPTRAKVEEEKKEEPIPEMTTVIKPPKPMTVKKTKVEKEVKETKQGPVEVIRNMETTVEEINPPASQPASQPASRPSSRPSSRVSSLAKQADLRPILESLEIDTTRVSIQRGGSSYTVDQLRDFLRKLGKSPTGNKDVLAMRLKEILNEYGM
jgi:hypothetical protein